MERGRKGPAIRRRRGGLRPEQRHLEGGSLRRGERVEGLVDDPVEEISEGREGELRLGLGGPRRERAVGAGSSLRQGVEPQSALADARFASEDQGLRPRRDGIEERRDAGELGLPAEPGALHRLPPTSFRVIMARSRFSGRDRAAVRPYSSHRRPDLSHPTWPYARTTGRSALMSRRRMKMDRMRTLGRWPVRWLGLLAAAAMLLIAPLGSSTALAAGSTVGFGFHAPDVSGFPTGSVALTGGGAFNLSAAAGTVHAGGGFSCTHDVRSGLPVRLPAGRGCPVGHGGPPAEHDVQVHGCRR